MLCFGAQFGIALRGHLLELFRRHQQELLALGGLSHLQTDALQLDLAHVRGGGLLVGFTLPAAGPAQATTPAPGAADGASGEATAAGEQEPPDPTAVILFRGVTWLVERVQENAGLFGRQAIQTGAGAVQAALSLLTSVGFFFFGAFITGFFFFFVSVRYARVIEFLDSLVPVQNRALVRELTGQMDRVIAGFIRGRVTICAFFIVYFTIAYWLIGVPAPLALMVRPFTSMRSTHRLRSCPISGR